MNQTGNEAGVTVPRCEKFRYAELPAVASVPGFAIGDRELILAWYNALKSTAVGHYYDNKMTFGPLAWLPHGDLARLWEALDDGRMMTILSVGVQEAIGLHDYSNEIFLLDPTTGQGARWKAHGFGDLAKLTKPTSDAAAPAPSDVAAKPAAGFDFTGVTDAELGQVLADLEHDGLPLDSPYADQVRQEIARRAAPEVRA